MVTVSWMEVMSPNSGWIPASRRSGMWTQQENKIFEYALAQIDYRVPDRWERVAAVLPGKTVPDVISHYNDLEDDVNHIEAGLVRFPEYRTSSFTLDLEGGFDGIKQSYCTGGKRGRFSDQDKKKGVSWTEEEHRQFLLGLKKHGKGDWRNISRYFVVTRTPTQVASHAQKYFNRINSGSKDKRRASIHDITIANITDNSPPLPFPPSEPTIQSATAVAPGKPDSDQTKETARMYSPSFRGNQFAQLSNGSNPAGIKLEAKNPHRGMLNDTIVAHRMMFSRHK